MANLTRTLLRSKTFRNVYALKSFLTIVRTPNRVDQVFALAETFFPHETLSRIALALAASPVTERALAERVRLERIDLARLRKMPVGSLGYEFAAHMDRERLDPATLPKLTATSDPMFVRAHLFETHDIWHVVTGFGTDVPGEIGVQAFYLAQFPSRLASTILAAGLLHASMVAIDRKDAFLEAIVSGYTLGRNAKPLFGVRWDDLWETSLATIRADLGILPAGDAGVRESGLRNIDAVTANA